MAASPLPEAISCPRLEIRTWQPDDAVTLAELIEANLDHLRPWMPWIAAEPRTLAERRALFAGWEASRSRGDDVTYGVFLDGEPVGGTGLHGRIGPGGFEIGYWIGRAHTRRGFATEVARTLTEAALARPDIDRVEIHHDEENRASGGIPKTLGFELVDRRAYEVGAPGESGVRLIWRLKRHSGSGWRRGRRGSYPSGGALPWRDEKGGSTDE